MKYNIAVTTTITNYFEVEAKDGEDARIEALSEQIGVIREMRFAEFGEESSYEIEEAKIEK